MQGKSAVLLCIGFLPSALADGGPVAAFVGVEPKLADAPNKYLALGNLGRKCRYRRLFPYPVGWEAVEAICDGEQIGLVFFREVEVEVVHVSSSHSSSSFDRSFHPWDSAMPR